MTFIIFYILLSLNLWAKLWPSISCSNSLTLTRKAALVVKWQLCKGVPFLCKNSKFLETKKFEVKEQRHENPPAAWPCDVISQTMLDSRNETMACESLNGPLVPPSLQWALHGYEHVDEAHSGTLWRKLKRNNRDGNLSPFGKIENYLKLEVQHPTGPPCFSVGSENHCQLYDLGISLRPRQRSYWNLVRLKSRFKFRAFFEHWTGLERTGFHGTQVTKWSKQCKWQNLAKA